MAEFDWWLLILGLVVGGGLVYLVVAESVRHEEDVHELEWPAEADWIAERLAERGATVDPATAIEVLREHRAYLALPPPEPATDDDLPVRGSGATQDDLPLRGPGATQDDGPSVA